MERDAWLIITSIDNIIRRINNILSGGTKFPARLISGCYDSLFLVFEFNFAFLNYDF